MNVKKVIQYVFLILLIPITIIGCYGIWKAPESDREELDQELRRNEYALQQNEDAPEAETAAPKQNQSPAATARTDRKNTSLSVIGDSVFLGAAPAFLKLQKNAVIDAKISRQVFQALDVAKKLNKKHKLGDTVIIALGTNGNFNPATATELIDYLGSKRSIYWIDVYGKKLAMQKQINANIKKIAEKYENVHLICWSEEGKKHPGWFYQDGIHLNTKGQTGFADFIWHSVMMPENPS